MVPIRPIVKLNSISHVLTTSHNICIGTVSNETDLACSHDFCVHFEVHREGCWSQGLNLQLFDYQSYAVSHIPCMYGQGEKALSQVGWGETWAKSRWMTRLACYKTWQCTGTKQCGWRPFPMECAALFLSCGGQSSIVESQLCDFVKIHAYKWAFACIEVHAHLTGPIREVDWSKHPN